MKTFKLTKAGLLILAAGAFIVVLAGLGITQYGQVSEGARLEEELSLSAMRLKNMDLKPLQEQLAGLQEKLKNSESQLQEAKEKLDQTAISVDVADEFYIIASRNDVIVDSIGTTKIKIELYENVSCSMTTINAAVDGDLVHIIDFIAALNDSFTTGFVRSTQIKINGAAVARGTEANITMVVYSYEGS